MKLTDYNARFVGEWHEEGRTFRNLDGVEGAQGVMFQCPKCAKGCEPFDEDGERGFRGAHYILCWFVNPRNAPRVPDHVDPKPGRWNFTGDSLDTLTFVGPGATSILLTGQGCQWHGYINNGQLSDA